MPKVGKRIIVHSYGAGVQSRALFYWYVQGFAPAPDVVIFADTQQEPEEVYRAIEVDSRVAKKAGIDFRVISYGDLANPPAHPGGRSVMTPLFTISLKETQGKKRILPAGTKGQLLRTCTERYKIGPIRRELRSMEAKTAEMWLGISTDEVQRVKPSSRLWVTHRYPLIEMGWSRKDCEAFLAENGIKATRSACTFCPYKGSTEWNYLSPVDLEKAIAYDESIRHSRPGYLCYVHVSCKPLREALAEKAASTIDDECSGSCWF